MMASYLFALELFSINCNNYMYASTCHLFCCIASNGSFCNRRVHTFPNFYVLYSISVTLWCLNGHMVFTHYITH